MEREIVFLTTGITSECVADVVFHYKGCPEFDSALNISIKSRLERDRTLNFSVMSSIKTI